MKLHLHPPRLEQITCRYCGKPRTNLTKHIRSMHKDVALPKRTYFKSPYPDTNGWMYIKKKVTRLIHNDFKRWPNNSEIRMQKDNTIIHAIAKLVYDRWKCMDDIDDAGGWVAGGLLLRHYALFQLSLDRKDNARPHFLHNSLQNLSFVPLGMNNTASIVAKYGTDTCKVLRERVAEGETAAIMNNGKISRCLHDIYNRDLLTRQHFRTYGAFKTHATRLLQTQKNRCAISTITMSYKRGENSWPFQPSLDAIEPAIGHISGNLRWVCLFLNATDFSKVNRHPDEVPHRWTSTLFRQYVRIGLEHVPKKRGVQQMQQMQQMQQNVVVNDPKRQCRSI